MATKQIKSKITPNQERLTPEQEAEMPLYVEKWTNIGLSTEPTNRKAAEKGAKLAYELAGLTPPKKITWFESPLAGAVYAAKKLDQHSFPQAIYGNHEAGWLSFYDFLEDHGIDCNIVEGVKQVALNAGWWWALSDEIVMTDRPVELHLDNEGRLHNQTGPSIKYADGFALYNWHGTEVPQEWILDPGSIDPKTALTWSNIEQRRCAAEILGWNKILSTLNPKVVDTDPDEMIGELLEVDLPDSKGEKFLRVRCGTGRTFCLPVPPEMKTALEANAWTYGVDSATDINQFREYAART